MWIKVDVSGSYSEPNLATVWHGVHNSFHNLSVTSEWSSIRTAALTFRLEHRSAMDGWMPYTDNSSSYSCFIRRNSSRNTANYSYSSSRRNHLYLTHIDLRQEECNAEIILLTFNDGACSLRLRLVCRPRPARIWPVCHFPAIQHLFQRVSSA